MVEKVKRMECPPGFIDVSQILRSGVYMLLSRGVPIYIGKSKRMLHRLYAHRTKGDKPSWHPIRSFTFDEVFILPVHVDRLDEVERQMVELYKPRFNMNLKTAARVGLPPSFFARLTPGLSYVAALPPAPKFERRV